MTFFPRLNIVHIFDNPTNSTPDFFPSWNDLPGWQNESVTRIRSYYDKEGEINGQLGYFAYFVR